MPPKRVIIVEDSVTAADDLVADLEKHLDIEIIGVFDTTKSALPILRLGQVDGVFLDIGFRENGGGEKDGLELAKQISALSPAPWIIFITGLKEHALDAINLLPPNILYGYLLKPYTETHLINAIDKVRHHISQPASPQIVFITPRIEVRHRRITELNGHIDQANITTMIDIADIRYVHTEDGTVRVHLENGDVLKNVNIILKDWEKILLTEHIDFFQQIHRQAIVNLRLANGIRPDPEREECFLALFRGCPDQLRIGAVYLNAYREAIRTGRRIPIKRGIDPNIGILYVHQDYSVNVHLIDGRVLIDTENSFTTWKKKLLTERIDYFQPIHNQFIVNLTCANGIEPDPERVECFLALFKDCADRLKIDPTYLHAYKEALKTGKRYPPNPPINPL